MEKRKSEEEVKLRTMLASMNTQNAAILGAGMWSSFKNMMDLWLEFGPGQGSYPWRRG